MKKFLALILAMCMVLALCACGAKEETAAPAAPSGTEDAGETKVEPRVFQLGHLDPSSDTNAYQIFCVTFAEKLKEVSGGTMLVEVYGDAQLGGEIEMFEAMKLGDLDMAMITNNYYSNFVKDFMVFDLPFIFADYDEEHLVVDDPEILGYLQDKVYEQHGVHLLTYADSGFRYVVNNRNPIAKVEDLKGLKIRLPETTLYVKTFEALGANPTTMAFSEAPTAVQQKTVDGLEITASAIYSGSFYQICDYLSLTSHFCSPITLNMSDATWTSLTEEEQAWVMEAAALARDESRVKVIDNEQKLLDTMAAEGCQINELEDVAEFQTATAPVLDWIRGEIGDELLDMVLAKLGR